MYLFYYLSYQQEQQRAIYLFKNLLGKLRLSEQGVTHEEASMSSDNKNEEGECLKRDTFLC